MTRRTGLRVAVASVVAVLGVGLLGHRWATADDFADAKAQAAFCEAASPLDLQVGHDLTLHEKHHILEDVREAAPDGVRGDFDTLLDWYDHFDPEDEEDAREASVTVGEFIERSCEEINIGGVRAKD
ncbi:hypothetical protein [Streptomyces sp. NPDC093094]|uniref:hypothetical protein n=1 Tax=Streptomyces sp. NPDC093094 TaxID=3366026 RepID=UPI00382F6909